MNGSALSNQTGREQVLAGDQQQGFDILKVLWRWKWLPILAPW